MSSLAEVGALGGELANEYPFASHHFDHAGVAQHYLDEGPRNGAPIVFVHGNPSWSFLWREPIRRLRGEFRCVAPDHVGMGLSDKPSDYDYRLARHTANLEALLVALELTNITLVVHDWGGPIGLGFAVRQRERIARLVITNTAAFTGLAAPWRIRLCRTPIFGALAVRGFNAFAGAATHMAVEKPMSALVRSGFVAPYRDWKSRVAVLRFVEDIPLSPSDRSWNDLLELERALPSLASLSISILWGERDFCFTPRYREEWQRRFPNAEVTRFENAGHYLFEDAREEACDVLSRIVGSSTVRP